MTVGTQRRDRLRALVYRVRSIPGERFALRPYTVSIVTAWTSGDITGDGSRAETLTPITEAKSQPPKVRWLKDDEIATGALPPGTVEVGPMTPELGAKLSDLLGNALTTGELRLFRLTGPRHPGGADYRFIGVGHDRALRHTIRLAPVGSQV